MDGKNTFEVAVRLQAALQLPNIGLGTMRKALDGGADPLNSVDFTRALKAASRRSLDDAFDALDFDNSIGACWDDLELVVNDGQAIITYLDADYPTKLRDLPDPPAILFCRGNVALLNEKLPAVAVVGSRRASEYGLRVARRFGEVLAEANTTVISGLAIGCDTSAHEGCLDKDGATIAVLPSSLDNIVPEQNKGLADRIISHRGLLVCEQSSRSQIDRSAFVRRNRIQAALSDKVIIVETSTDGGTMRTVDFARKLKRPIGVFGFPEKYRNESNDGNDELINGGEVTALSDMDSITTFMSYGIAKSEDQLALPFGE